MHGTTGRETMATILDGEFIADNKPALLFHGNNWSECKHLLTANIFVLSDVNWCGMPNSLCAELQQINSGTFINGKPQAH